MTTDLHDLVQSALGRSYVLERELGGGAMSRVFLATEASLGRKVVLKLLSPDLAGAISIERFRREVLVTAGLQHPFIVPVLSAGEAVHLPYYTMPFVAGESLRARLARDGRLPMNDVIGVVRDIAAAFEYAHAQGIVHRDLKPENVLLSGGHAIVTDFGIAKAIAAATGAEGATAVLTQTGTSIGTPFYMAPEQAAGDPATDHRADLYALGVMTYELLTGRGPFGGRTPQQMLAAHLTEPPRPLLEIEPSVDSRLAHLVMQLLEKDPAARPQTAEEVVAALSAVSASGSAPVRRGARFGGSRVRVALAVTGAAVATVATFATVRWTRADASPPEAPRVIVLPFENRSGDQSLSPIASMAAEWVTHGVRESGAVDVLEPSAVGKWDASSNAADVARTLEAGFAVAGSVYRVGDSVRFSARIIDAAAREVVRTIPDVSAPVSAPMPAIDAVRSRVIGALAAAVDPAINQFTRLASQPPSFEAYSEYVQARTAHLRGENRVALKHAYRALALDSNFTLPYIVVTFAHAQLGECAISDSILGTIEPRRSRLPVFDRLQLDRGAAMCRGDGRGVYEAARALRRFAPRSSQTAVQVGSAALRIGRIKESVAFFDSVRADHPAVRDNIGYFNNYAHALHWAGSFERELTVTARGLEQFPTHSGLVALELGALAALGRTGDVMSRMRELQNTASLPDSVVGEVLYVAASELEAHGHDSDARAAWNLTIEWFRAQRDGKAAWAEEGYASSLLNAKRWSDVHALIPQFVRTYAGQTFFEGGRAIVAVHLGLRAEVDSAKAILVGRGDAESRYWLALVSAHEGDRERAVAQIRDALTRGLPYEIGLLHHEPLLAPLREYPPFKALIAPRG